VDNAAHRLALGLQQLAHLWAPDEICLGGGVIDHQPEALKLAVPAFRAIEGRLVPSPQIVRGPLSADDAGVIGAALLADILIA
jgi:predicted NBD/HSP70 family sugar kinase